MHHCTDEKKPTGDGNPTAGSTDRAIVPDTTSTSKITSRKTGQRFLALNKALNELVLRVWCAAPSSWGRATVRPGARHTTKQAGNLPDSEVFSRSEFMVSGLGVSIRKDGSTTCFVCLHPAPPDGLDSHCVGFQFNKERETMTASPVASRSAAPTLTPTTRKTPSHFDPVATHGEAVNACAMASYYTRKGNHAGAARKAVQALSALRKLAAFERQGVTA